MTLNQIAQEDSAVQLARLSNQAQQVIFENYFQPTTLIRDVAIGAAVGYGVGYYLEKDRVTWAIGGALGGALVRAVRHIAAYGFFSATEALAQTQA